MLPDLFMAASGLVLLLGGGELLVRGAVGLARRLGISPLLIGLSVVAAATSMPELVVVLTSAFAGVPDLGVGSIVGSNTANVLLILGTAAAFWPIAIQPRHILRDGLAALGATLLFIILALFGEIGHAEGALLLLLIAGYLALGYLSERRLHVPEPDPPGDPGMAVVPALLLIALGVGALLWGSERLVAGAVALAQVLGVSDSVIGLTLVAVGTSLPELATAVVAGLRRQPEIALGNVLGSNLFNLLGVLGTLALVTPFRVAPELLHFDLWVMAGSAAVLLPVMFTGWRVGRLEGALFLAAYGLYVAAKYQPLG